VKGFRPTPKGGLVLATAAQPVTENRNAARALEWARSWYPTAELAVTGITAASASVLVEVDGDMRIVQYENLDADVPRCGICGRPL
jgi:hypothetical protein